MLTLNQTLKALNRFAIAHGQINSFGAGDLEDFATSGTTIYPVMWVDIEPGSVQDIDTMSYSSSTYRIYLMDRQQKGQENQFELWSDMQLVAYDLISHLKDPNYFTQTDTLLDVNQITINPIRESNHDDELIGWYFDLTLKSNYTQDTCQIPFDSVIPVTPGVCSPCTTGGGGTSITSGTVTSVDLSMPSAFTVSGNPITSSGTLTVTGAGTTSQYIRGDGTLANFPTSIGGGASVNYYFNGGTSQGTINGNTYYQLSKTATIGSAANFNISSNGYIAEFITDANDPNQLNIPAGNWNFECYFSSSSSGGTPSFYVELYKYDGANFTLIATNSASPEGITNGTTIDLYSTALAVPSTTLSLTDRLAIRIYVNNSGRTITLYTQDSHLSEVITTFSNGITALNGLTAQVQTLSTGTTGNDFNISSSSSIHTFNLPTASATKRGALSTTDWSTFNGKQDALGYTPVPNTRNLTINGTTYDLSADRSWTIAAGVTSVNSATGAVTLTVSDTGTGGTLQWSGTTLQLPEAASTKTGLLTSTDWSTFNSKQNALTNPVTGTGTNNEIAYFNSTGSSIGSLTTATYPSLTELSYVKGVTSAIQTQINALPTASSTTTLTNKRITARTGTVTSSATPIINTDNVDYFSITALAANITSMTTNLSGTPTTGQTLWISITDNGTARTITWGASFENSGNISLPTTTVISTRLDIAFIWNEATSKWRCVGVA